MQEYVSKMQAMSILDRFRRKPAPSAPQTVPIPPLARVFDRAVRAVFGSEIQDLARACEDGFAQETGLRAIEQDGHDSSWKFEWERSGLSFEFRMPVLFLRYVWDKERGEPQKASVRLIVTSPAAGDVPAASKHFYAGINNEGRLVSRDDDPAINAELQRFQQSVMALGVQADIEADRQQELKEQAQLELQEKLAALSDAPATPTQELSTPQPDLGS